MMVLAPGERTGRKAEAHAKADQVLLLLSGKLSGDRRGGVRPFEKGRHPFDPRRNATSV
jgi:hypothetical protein